MNVKQRGEFLSRRVRWLGVEEIRPNPHQPRRTFEEQGLAELADSIRSYGILQPLTVRRTETGYELIAGERRLRAAKLAGERQVPCLVARVGEEDSALLALMENLQRRDLDCWEEAEAIARLITTYNLTQEQAAEKIGKSQSAVANKLRLLRLSRAVRDSLRQKGLSERHARALLRLSDEHQQLCALEEIARRGYNVARTEEYVEQLLQQNRQTPPQGRATYIIKDVRLFLNSVERGLGIMRRAGVDAQIGRSDTDEEIRLTIRIPKKRHKSPVVTNL
ncbi:MAG: ParB/RepB/Spo0J family partition protein [Oscillospiraceae bacterium]|nr:ParB/RepB/Spo0J family partition protein [Oscillospiraceae bacterium]